MDRPSSPADPIRSDPHCYWAGDRLQEDRIRCDIFYRSSWTLTRSTDRRRPSLLLVARDALVERHATPRHAVRPSVANNSCDVALARSGTLQSRDLTVPSCSGSNGPAPISAQPCRPVRAARSAVASSRCHGSALKRRMRPDSLS